MTKINVFPEKIFMVLGIGVTNTLFTSILTTFLIVLFVTVFRPKFLEVFVYWVFKFTDKITENRALTKRIFPVCATFLVFIGVSNFLALMPGFLGSFYLSSEGNRLPILRSPNSDLSITLALAIVSVVAMEYFSVSALGLVKFIKRFFNFGSLTKFFTGLFELLSEITKLISFSFRLFGNVLAGEIVLLVTALFSPFILPLPFLALETFIGLIQAFIFYVLTASFIENATLREAKEVDQVG